MTKKERLEKIKIRHQEMLEFDKAYANFVLGLDEVGRGPLFGCTVAVACNIKPSPDLVEVFDSKKLSEKKRERLFDIIIENANCYGIGIVEPITIDQLGIQNAIALAMKQALDSCYAKLSDTFKKNDKFADTSNTLILSDYITFDIEGYDYFAVKKGDTMSFQIACASILAKVTRDRIISDLDKDYPEYDLKNNKGYGTKKHIEAIKKYGATEQHRMSFLRGILGEKTDEGSE